LKNGRCWSSENNYTDAIRFTIDESSFSLGWYQGKYRAYLREVSQGARFFSQDQGDVLSWNWQKRRPFRMPGRWSQYISCSSSSWRPPGCFARCSWRRTLLSLVQAASCCAVAHLS